MAGDIKLNDTGVEVVGTMQVEQIASPNRQLKIDAWDLLLDSQDRRSPNDIKPPIGVTIIHSQYRRALVHDVGDKLTINYAADYPGGVNIAGSTTVNHMTVTGHLSGPVAKLLGYSWYGAPKAITCFAQDLVLANKEKDPDAPLKNVALSHMPGDKLVINRDNGYKGGVEITGPVSIPQKLSVQGLDLVAEINQLKAEIKALKAK